MALLKAGRPTVVCLARHSSSFSLPGLTEFEKKYVEQQTEIVLNPPSLEEELAENKNVPFHSCDKNSLHAYQRKLDAMEVAGISSNTRFQHPYYIIPSIMRSAELFDLNMSELKHGDSSNTSSILYYWNTNQSNKKSLSRDQFEKLLEDMLKTIKVLGFERCDDFQNIPYENKPLKKVLKLWKDKACEKLELKAKNIRSPLPQDLYRQQYILRHLNSSNFLYGESVNHLPPPSLEILIQMNVCKKLFGDENYAIFHLHHSASIPQRWQIFKLLGYSDDEIISYFKHPICVKVWPLWKSRFCQCVPKHNVIVNRSYVEESQNLHKTISKFHSVEYQMALIERGGKFPMRFDSTLAALQERGYSKKKIFVKMQPFYEHHSFEEMSKLWSKVENLEEMKGKNDLEKIEVLKYFVWRDQNGHDSTITKDKLEVESDFVSEKKSSLAPRKPSIQSKDSNVIFPGEENLNTIPMMKNKSWLHRVHTPRTMSQSSNVRQFSTSSTCQKQYKVRIPSYYNFMRWVRYKIDLINFQTSHDKEFEPEDFLKGAKMVNSLIKINFDV